MVCPSEKRFQLLFTFLKKNKNKKIMVFFSSCAAVQYYHELLNYIEFQVQCIHVSYILQYLFLNILFYSIKSALYNIRLRLLRMRHFLNLINFDKVINFMIKLI